MSRRFFNPSRTAVIALTTATLMLAGCATIEPTPYVPLTGDALVDGNAQLAVARAKDKVLWEYRIAATAMRRGLFEEARAKLDDALAQAAANYGNINSEAARSRRMFRKESDKPFVGEPYERAMASFYRGIVYWSVGEPDNARALMRSAQLLDSDTVDKTYAGDYVLFDYLDGYASEKLGGDGSDALARSRANARAQGRATPPDYDRKANVMIFAEYGRGPRKYAGGEYSEQLKFTTDQSRARGAILQIDGRTVKLPAYDDINFQATSRGGRIMDHVLGNKAVFKGTTNTVGDVALVGAAVSANNIRRYDGSYNKDAANVAIGLAAIGIISKIASSAANSEADTRTWDNLPQYISFAALRLAPGEYPATLTFVDASGNPLPSGTRQITLTVPAPDPSIGAAPQDTVIFLSELPN
ncbi:hypothetical protein [Nibricoccus aquaticus]|nr:hypothetical protein [Nibricoccus aquaticus]